MLIVLWVQVQAGIYLQQFAQIKVRPVLFSSLLVFDVILDYTLESKPSLL